MSRNWIIAGVAAVCFITGVAVSHVIEPGVRVEKVMLRGVRFMKPEEAWEFMK